MKVLCNLPLECFAPRDSFPEIELVTFGPAGRMQVDGKLFPFDICFDPSLGTIEQLWSLLPRGFEPDLLLLWWPDQEPIPAGLDRSPARVVGVLSDYNISLQAVAGLWPYFDVLLVDRAGVPLFERLTFPDVRYFCQYTYKAHSHFPHHQSQRDIDIGFVGNLNPKVQRERAAWIDRLHGLTGRGLRVSAQFGLFGHDYGALLSRCKIGFNRSIRGEANLRTFEVPACGACLFVERENLEVRDFFVPGEEIVLYADDDFEDLVELYSRDDVRRERIARAGLARVQQHGLPQRLLALRQVLAAKGPGRPPADEFALHLGRANALGTTWAKRSATLPDYLAAHRARPDDPRPLNGMAIAILANDPKKGHAAIRLLAAAAERDPSYLPAIANLHWILDRAGLDSRRAVRERLLNSLADARALRCFDGAAMSSTEPFELTRALLEAVQVGEPTDQLRDAWLVAAGLAPISCPT